MKYFCFSSPIGTKEAFCRPWWDLLEIVIENPALKRWAISADCLIQNS